MVQSISLLNLNNVVGGRKNPPAPTKGDFSAPYTMLPEGERNYCLFNQDKVNFIVSQKERAIPYLKQILETSEDEKEIVETLYIVDRLCDNGTKGIPAMYPILARFNDTKSENIQAFLAGIYRKTQVPDAFGPLVVMLIRNAIEGTGNREQGTERGQNAGGQEEECHCEESCLQDDAAIQKNHSPFTIHHSPFDPNEEIGGAILAYIENYSNTPKKIDYSA